MIFKAYNTIKTFDSNAPLIKISDSSVWVYFLYVFDFIMLIICAFIIRHLKTLKKKQKQPIVLESFISDFDDERVYKG